MMNNNSAASRTNGNGNGNGAGRRCRPTTDLHPGHLDLPCPREKQGTLEGRIHQLTSQLEAKTLELERSGQQLARVASELILAEQRERDRLAQLLHDGLQQLLVGANYSLRMIARQAGPDETDPLAHALAALAEAIQVSRSLAMELAPPFLHEAGLPAGLEWLARWMRKHHRLEVSLAMDDVGHLRQDVEILLFTSARELLFNVVKHAGVERAHLELAMLDLDPAQIALSVIDEGTGFNCAAQWNTADVNTTGCGLPIMRERLGLLGGSSQVWSVPGRGSRVRLFCPLLPAPGRARVPGATPKSDHPPTQLR